MPLKTKIIATISNHNCSPEFIKGLYRAGMNVVRLNTAHMSHEDALEVIANTRAVSNKIGILLDTKGPEIRTCNCSEPISVKYGDYVRVKGAPDELSQEDLICVSYDRFVNDVPIGSSILIDDGHIMLTVMEKNDAFLTCFVENDGEIQGRKSINIPSVHVKLPALSHKDIGFIEFAAEHDLDFIAHSFVRNKEDVLAVQNILDRKNSPIKIIAKIENAEGVENINEILDHVSEAKQSFVFQEWLFSWYDLKFFDSLKKAQTFGQKRYNNIIKRNKKAKKDWRPNAYGVEQIHPTRIVDKSSRPFKYYPGTQEDEKNWNKHKKQYLQEAKKIKYVKKPDFMTAMGIDPDYVVKEISPDVFQIAKFTHGKEPAEVYRCEWTGKTWKCNCYSRKGSCKHVDIVQKFVKGKKRNVFDKSGR